MVSCCWILVLITQLTCTVQQYSGAGYCTVIMVHHHLSSPTQAVSRWRAIGGASFFVNRQNSEIFIGPAPDNN